MKPLEAAPLTALILRPSGVMQGIDFDRIDAELIVPALSALDMEPIRSDSGLSPEVLELLLTARIVLVDASAPNAYLAYRLGLAHALRDKRTIVMAAVGTELILDPWLVRLVFYERANPSASIQELVGFLRGALEEDRINSPVYTLLPGLQPPHATTVPDSFDSELEAATRMRDAGHLRLLSQEVRTFHWAPQALPRIGEAQLHVPDLQGARETLEHLLSLAPDDPNVSLRLGTIYQRLREPRRSNEVINQALAALGPESKERAEALALLGRNAKAGWLEVWRAAPPEQWGAEALRCPQLEVAYDYYYKSFKQDLNQYFCGLSALALARILIALGEALPEVWAELFEDDAEAASRLDALQREAASIAAGVSLALDAASERLPARDVWLEVSKADLALLTSERPGRVAERYRRAIFEAPQFVADSVLAQIAIYRDLGVLKSNVDAAMEVLGTAGSPPVQARVPTRGRALLFVGHAIDARDRAAPRFPAAGEPIAQQAIRRAVDEETRSDRAAWIGVAGASSGGDILFHESCETLGIPVKICLAVPASEYALFGIADAGAQWETRYRELISRNAHQVLSDTSRLPAWLESNARYDFRRRDTLWRYHTAAAMGEVTVIALWDGQEGAAADAVRMAKERGAKVIVLDTTRLFADLAGFPHPA